MMITMFNSRVPGKARRLKQAKDEAQDEVEKYRQERERQFKEFEAKVMLFTDGNGGCTSL